MLKAELGAGNIPPLAVSTTSSGMSSTSLKIENFWKNLFGLFGSVRLVNASSKILVLVLTFRSSGITVPTPFDTLDMSLNVFFTFSQ